MPALFLQLDRNRQFWHGKPAFPVRTDYQPSPCTRPPSNNPAGARIVFQGSPVVFQYYPGQGLQLQPLANFGLANGLIAACRHDPATCDRPGIKHLLDDMVAIRSPRGGFITWEYFFYFGGGTPPWTSGMSSGTAIQALARARSRRSSTTSRTCAWRAARSACSGRRRRSGSGCLAWRQPLPDLLVRTRPSRAERLPPGDHGALRLREGVGRQVRARARERREPCRRARAAPLRHRTLVALQRRRGGVVARLPPARDRLPRRPLHAPARQVLHVLQPLPLLPRRQADGDLHGQRAGNDREAAEAALQGEQGFVRDRGGHRHERQGRVHRQEEGRARPAQVPVDAQAPGGYVLTLKAVDQNKNATSPSFTLTVG